MKQKHDPCGGTGKISKPFSVYDQYHKKDIIIFHQVSCDGCSGTGEVGEDDPPSEESKDHRKLED